MDISIIDEETLAVEELKGKLRFVYTINDDPYDCLFRLFIPYTGDSFVNA